MRVCSGCRDLIDGAAIVSEGKYFHPEHFCCDRCKQPVGMQFHKYKKWRMCSSCLPRPVCASNQCSESNRRIGGESGSFYRLPVDTRLAAFHGCHTVRCSVCGRGIFCCSAPTDGLAYHLREGRITCTRCYYKIDQFNDWKRNPKAMRSGRRLWRRLVNKRKAVQLSKPEPAPKEEPRADLQAFESLMAQIKMARRASADLRKQMLAPEKQLLSPSEMNAKLLQEKLAPLDGQKLNTGQRAQLFPMVAAAAAAAPAAAVAGAAIATESSPLTTGPGSDAASSQTIQAEAPSMSTGAQTLTQSDQRPPASLTPSLGRQQRSSATFLDDKSPASQTSPDRWRDQNSPSLQSQNDFSLSPSNAPSGQRRASWEQSVRQSESDNSGRALYRMPPNQLPAHMEAFGVPFGQLRTIGTPVSQSPNSEFPTTQPNRSESISAPQVNQRHSKDPSERFHDSTRRPSEDMPERFRDRTRRPSEDMPERFRDRTRRPSEDMPERFRDRTRRPSEDMPERFRDRTRRPSEDMPERFRDRRRRPSEDMPERFRDQRRRPSDGPPDGFQGPGRSFGEKQRF